MSSFSAAVFIVGGSGIAFALSAIPDIVQRDIVGESRVKLIELVWVVSDAGMSFPTQPFESAILKKSSSSRDHPPPSSALLLDAAIDLHPHTHQCILHPCARREAARLHRRFTSSPIRLPSPQI